jgi:hypothetical protein
MKIELQIIWFMIFNFCALGLAVMAIADAHGHGVGTVSIIGLIPFFCFSMRLALNMLTEQAIEREE